MPRIRDKRNPDWEGILVTSEQAKAKLDEILKERRARGWRVFPEEDEEGPVYRVVNEPGKEEIFYIEE